MRAVAALYAEFTGGGIDAALLMLRPGLSSIT